MRKSGSCMLGGSAPIKWQACLYTCMSIKRGRNIAVFRGSVVNAFEAEVPDFPSLKGLAHLGPKSRVALSYSSLVTRSYRGELPVPMFLSACKHYLET